MYKRKGKEKRPETRSSPWLLISSPVPIQNLNFRVLDAVLLTNLSIYLKQRNVRKSEESENENLRIDLTYLGHGLRGNEESANSVYK